MMNHKRPKHRFGLILSLFLFVIVVFLLVDSNTRITEEKYDLYYDTLPDEFDGFCVVQLSDLHEVQFGKDNEKLYEIVCRANPDIIAVTGDVVDSPGQSTYVRQTMVELTKIAPVFYVTGNHEWATGETNEFFKILKECGVTALRNQFVRLYSQGTSIVLAGIDDPNGPYDMKTPAELMKEIRTECGTMFTVLLAHRNSAVETYRSLGAELILCGHAHGGLIRLPFTDGLIDTNRNWFPTYTNGVYPLNDMTELVVSRGLGNSTGTFRFLNNPHIPIIRLHTK